MKTALMMIVVVVAFSLASCGPTPKQEAEARAIDSATGINESAGIIENQKQQVLNELEIERLRALQAQKVETFNLLLRFGGFTLMGMTLCLGIGVGYYGWKNLIPGLMKAAVVKAQVKAQTIYPDARGFFPQIYIPAFTAGNDYPMLTDMTGSTRNLLEKKELSPAELQAKTSIQMALILSLAAAKMPHGNVISGKIEDALSGMTDQVTNKLGPAAGILDNLPDPIEHMFQSISKAVNKGE